VWMKNDLDFGNEQQNVAISLGYCKTNIDLI